MLTPDQLSSSIQELTGFLWTIDGFDQMKNDDRGYRLLAGGVDGLNAFEPVQDPGISWMLTLKRLSQLAADYAVERSFSEEGSGLLSLVDEDTKPGSEAFDEQLRALHWRMFGTEAAEDWLVDITGLWRQTENLEDPAAAWKTAHASE